MEQVVENCAKEEQQVEEVEEEGTEENLSPIKPTCVEETVEVCPTYEILSMEPLFVVSDDAETSIHAVEESGQEIVNEPLDDDEEDEDVKTDSVSEAMKKASEVQSRARGVLKKPQIQKKHEPESVPVIEEQIWDSKDEVEIDARVLKNRKNRTNNKTVPKTEAIIEPIQQQQSQNEMGTLITLMKQVIEEVRESKSKTKQKKSDRYRREARSSDSSDECRKVVVKHYHIYG